MRYLAGFLGGRQLRKRRQMPSGNLQSVHRCDETDKDTRVTGYSKQIQLNPVADRSTESLLIVAKAQIRQEEIIK